LVNSKSYNEIAYYSVCSVWEYSSRKRALEYLKKEGIEAKNEISFDEDTLTLMIEIAIEKINGLNEDSEEYNNMQLIKLDFLRRLGLAGEAIALIKTIKTNENFYQEIVIDIINFQEELLKNNDIQEHYLEEFRKE
jgi:hypothetical protein